MVDSQTYSSFSVKSSIHDYHVNFIEDIGSELAKKADNKFVFIVDEKVYQLFEQDFTPALNGARLIVIKCDEHFKTIDYCQEVIRKLIQQNVRKDNVLVAIGGGITQDIVAFIASIIFRGVEWQFFPTTLLAQCDSCIGSKSSINFDSYKNLLGTFNPPSEIFICPKFLITLSESEIKSGIGEMLHYFLTEGIDIAQKISDNYNKLFVERQLILPFINESLRIKKAVIEIDEFDTSIRHIFNYGHTFGHAIEAITDYAIPHGQAVSIGMDIANYISLLQSMITQGQFNEMHEILKKNVPAFKIAHDNLEVYCQALSKDKKNKGQLLGCILTYGPGRVEKKFLKIDDELKSALLKYSSLYSF